MLKLNSELRLHCIEQSIVVFEIFQFFNLVFGFLLLESIVCVCLQYLKFYAWKPFKTAQNVISILYKNLIIVICTIQNAQAVCKLNKLVFCCCGCLTSKLSGKLLSSTMCSVKWKKRPLIVSKKKKKLKFISNDS